jgi:hypothetical protein
MDHWIATDHDRCTCLTRDDHSLPHAAKCEAVTDDFAKQHTEIDRSDLRELAELAAFRDIDTALTVYRNHRKA